MRAQSLPAVDLGSQLVSHSQQLSGSQASPLPGSRPSKQNHNDPSIPDGGRGWLILTGCSIVAWWSIGTAQSWGVLQRALLEQHISTSVNLLFVGSLSAGLVSAFAILYSRVMRTIGTRWTGMIGISVMSLSGGITSCVYSNIGALFGAFGILMGIGMGYGQSHCSFLFHFAG